MQRVPENRVDKREQQLYRQKQNWHRFDGEGVVAR
jgi:hypothetical protein